MKKIRLLIITVLILFLLSSCNSDQQKKIIEEDNSKAIPVQINSDAEILLFDNHKIYYFIDRTHPQKPDLADKTLYEYNIIDKKSRAISPSYADISTCSGHVALIDNNIYIPLATNIENILVKINPEQSSSETIKKWSTFPPVSYVYSLKNNLIMFGPNSISDSITDYYIDKMDYNGKNQSNLVKKRIENSKGQLISCIDVDDINIYAFSITSKNGIDQTYHIIQYDLTGKECAAYPFDLKTYLNPSKTLVGQDDSVFNLYKQKDYFILNTLNGKVFIFKLLNNQLQPVALPENFYKNNPSGFRFIDYNGSDRNLAYFYNSFEHDNTITIFNSDTEKLTSLKIPIDNKITDCFRNSDGDLIIDTIDDKNSRACYYYHIDPSMLN